MKASHTRLHPEVRKHRKAVRPIFNGVPAPKLTGVSDTVAYATVTNARAARKAEKAWLKTLSRAERRRFA